MGKNEGILSLYLCDIKEWPRPNFLKEICRIGPDFTEEEEDAFDELWFWLRIARGLPIGCSWYVGQHIEHKRLSNEQKYKRACTA